MTTVVIQQNVGGYTGTIDSFVRESRANNSYLTATEINADGADSANAKIQGLLAFSGIFGDGPGQIPLGATITSATLTLSLSDGTKSPVSFYRMAQDWMGLPSLTWNSLGAGIQTDGVEALATADIAISALGSGIQSLDVLQSLQAWSDGATNNGWMISSGGTDGFAFSSSEGTSAPILTVTYELPTEPVPGLVVVESGGTTIVTEGGAGDSLSITLRVAPTSDVTITLSTSGAGDLSIAPTVLTFTTLNWNTAQTVALGAVNDTLIEGPESFSAILTATSADAGYNGLSSSVTVGVTDNDVVQTPTVVAVHDATLYKAGDPSGYGCGDPSGIAYVPGLDRLFIVDSEHDESPYFSSINLFTTRLDGTFVESFSLRGFTREPTGISYNPLNGKLYISDDDTDRIYIVDPNNPTAKITEINVKRFGITDAEDPEIDPETGHIFLLDGLTRTLVELTANGGFVRSAVLPSAISDAEGLAFDTVNDVFYIASGATRGKIFQTDLDGHILQTFNLLDSYVNPISGSKPKIKGLELAPSSDPHDGNKMSLYAVDYGVDQVADGRVFEIDLHDSFLFV